MLQGFKNFLMRGDVIVVAVGLSVALAFSNLVKAFTDDIVNPLIAGVRASLPCFAPSLLASLDSNRASCSSSSQRSR